MNPIHRPITPVAVFKLDEELDREYQRIYQACRAMYINYGSINVDDILESYACDKENAEKIIKDLKIEFGRNG